MICHKAWTPSSVLGHAKTHSNIPSKKTANTDLDTLIKQYNILESPPLLIPPSGEAPVPGLHIHKDGLACTFDGCSYACLSENTLRDHWYHKHHSSMPIVKPKQRFNHPVPVQSYYATVRNTFWTVNPDLSKRAPDDLYSAFVNDYLPQMTKIHDIPTPTLTRDIPPWLKVCKFHQYLGDYMTNVTKREHLVSAVTTPRLNDPLYGRLHKWIFEYMKDMMVIAEEQIPHTFLKHILFHGGE